VSGIQIDLTWADNANNEDGYEIWRSTDNVNFTKIGTLGVNSATYSATNLQAATQYWFKVRAFNSFQGQSFSSYSNHRHRHDQQPAAQPELLERVYGITGDGA
jgi:titin